MLNLHTIKISQNSIRKVAELDRFQGRWEALEAHTTTLHMLGDVALHGRELKAVFELFRAHPVDTAMAIRLNKILTGNKHEGDFRTSDTAMVFQDDGSIFGALEVPYPEDAAGLFGKLMEWLGRTLDDGDIHPLLTIAIFAGVFYQLAPFEHDNPKTIRQIITLLMFRKGYTYAPYALLDAPRGSSGRVFFDELSKLKANIDAGRPDWPSWIDYFLETLVERKNTLSAKLETDHSGLARMPALSKKIIALFDDHERIGMKEIERLTRGARATLKLRLGELVEDGYLKRHGQARSTWYARV